MRQGSKGAAVRDLQQRLKAKGYKLTVDGSFGPKTRAAVVAYQRAHGLVADGVAGPKTWASLKKAAAKPATPAKSTSTPTLKQGSSGASVRTLQSKLKAKGFNIAVDGSFGPKTRNAVISFQRANGLAVDGVVGPKTWAKLNSSSSKGPGKTTTTSGIHGSSALASAARSVAMSMGGYNSQGLCATGVSRAIQRTYGIKVWGNGNQIDNNLPRSKFKQINIPLSQALKIPGLVLTWEKTSTRLGSIYGHTAITLGDGHSSASDFVEGNTLAANGSRSGLKIFMPI